MSNPPKPSRIDHHFWMDKHKKTLNAEKKKKGKEPAPTSYRPFSASVICFDNIERDQNTYKKNTKVKVAPCLQEVDLAVPVKDSLIPNKLKSKFKKKDHHQISMRPTSNGRLKMMPLQQRDGFAVYLQDRKGLSTIDIFQE